MLASYVDFGFCVGSARVFGCQLGGIGDAKCEMFALRLTLDLHSDGILR